MTTFTGVGRLTRLALRRDRIQLPLWLVGLTVTHMASAASVLGLYPGRRTASTWPQLGAERCRARLQRAHLRHERGSDRDVADVHALRRRRRPDEHLRRRAPHAPERADGARNCSGRASSTARLTTAALVTVIGADLALGALTTGGLLAVGLPPAGSVAAGAGIAAVGAAFAAIAAVCAQLASTSRGASGLAATAVGLAFGLRALGDMVSDVTEGETRVVTSWPSWLSPIGWGEQIRAYHEDNWWLLALLAVFTAATIGAAFMLSARRDLGAGLLPSRPGPPHARPSLLGLWPRLAAATRRVRRLGRGADRRGGRLRRGRSGSGRSRRRQRGDAGHLRAARRRARDLTDAYLAATLAITGVAVAACTIQASLRLRGEEARARSSPCSPRQSAGNAGSEVMSRSPSPAPSSCSPSRAPRSGSPTGSPPAARPPSSPFTGAALGQAPAAPRPRRADGRLRPSSRHVTAVSWGAFAFCLLLGQLGELLNVPDAIRDLSPLHHLPAAPVENVTPGPILA